jgi:transcription termination/antitermination protein NusG
VLSVTSEPNSAVPESSTPDGLIPPTPAEAAPVAVPGAPPPPPHEAVEAGHELAQESAQEIEKPGDAAAAETTTWGSGEPGPIPSPAALVEPVAFEADEEIDEDEADRPFAAPLELIDETVADEDLKFDWYILKVQVNREDSIKDALWRRVKMNGLERYFKEIIVPTEDVIEFTKTGKKRTVKRKLYPGYILVNMAVSDESWFVVRETSGIGDFTGSAGKPTPMEPQDVERILRSSKVLPEEEGAGVKTTIPFKTGDHVRVKEGYFQNFEGDVHAIDQTHGRVTVMINIFGRATPVEIEHWQIEAV